MKIRGFYFLLFPFINFSGIRLFNGLRTIQIHFFRPCASSFRYALLFWRARHSADLRWSSALIHLRAILLAIPTFRKFLSKNLEHRPLGAMHSPNGGRSRSVGVSPRLEAVNLFALGPWIAHPRPIRHALTRARRIGQPTASARTKFGSWVCGAIRRRNRKTAAAASQTKSAAPPCQKSGG
jgi:hypothetical protein